ncbi:MAG TPA: DNA methyltransferase, partial [Aggregatilineales bacterium]|nr:DNA methyltransferase [Aggregatilineales bacterium]
DLNKLKQMEFEFAIEQPPSRQNGTVFNDPAFAANKSLPIHRWVPWIAGFSKDFVDGALKTHLSSDRGLVLDPFAGVGTTLVEGMLLGHDVVGFEINPYPHLASSTKLSISNISPEHLRVEIARFQLFYNEAILSKRTPTTGVPHGFHSRVPFYSMKVLTKVLTVLDFIASISDTTIANVFRIAFASTMVVYSNYSYEPSLATRASSGKQNVDDAPVGEIILAKLESMLADVKWYWRTYPQGIRGQHRIINDSFFNCQKYLEAASVDLIVTSPPYLNNYHYNRNTRPHLYWLGFAEKPGDLKPLEEANFGTYWQMARDLARVDLDFGLPDTDLQEKLDLLRKTNIDKGIYGGNGWANYAATYFNDCFRFAVQAQHVLKVGGVALVVIGNSILQGIMIPTDAYLAAVARQVGLETVSIDIPRATRVGSSIIQSDVRSVKANSRHQLYEAVVTLRKVHD